MQPPQAPCATWHPQLAVMSRPWSQGAYFDLFSDSGIVR